MTSRTDKNKFASTTSATYIMKTSTMESSRSSPSTKKSRSNSRIVILATDAGGHGNTATTLEHEKN